MYEGMFAESVTMRGHNDDPVAAYYARPLGPGPFPGVVVIHHMPGWDEWTREVVRKFAQHGYAAISPHLYSRIGEGSPGRCRRARPRAGRGRGRPGGRRCRGARRRSCAIRRMPMGKVGVIGFCSGGRHTYLVGLSPAEYRRGGRLLGRSGRRR